jgi:hypothetical protein
VCTSNCLTSRLICEDNQAKLELVPQVTTQRKTEDQEEIVALINCPECGQSPRSDQAGACPKCAHPIKKVEYRFCHVNGNTGSGHENLSRLQNEGWQIVDKHEEDEYNADGPFPLVVYKLMR